jgi:hypothetical protein
MAAQVTKCNGTVITIETRVDLSGSMLKAEEAIQAAVNETGVVASGEALRRFDADGDPIMGGSVNIEASINLPRYGCQVGLCIVLFDACSAFTRVTACTLARPPYFVARLFPKASATSLPLPLLR